MAVNPFHNTLLYVTTARIWVNVEFVSFHMQLLFLFAVFHAGCVMTLFLEYLISAHTSIKSNLSPYSRVWIKETFFC